MNTCVGNNLSHVCIWNHVYKNNYYIHIYFKYNNKYAADNEISKSTI